MDKKKYNIKRVRERRIMTKKKPITHDPFAVDTCTHCDGEGEIHTDVYDLIDVTKVAYTNTEECEMCKGTGVDQ
tara:strand:+ start:154 stop:375 length:222 start_codon:yes stop_codon:yes gene_type:complete